MEDRRAPTSILRRDVLCWQLSTTVLFALGYLVMWAIDAIDAPWKFAIYWMFYSMFTIYHALIYICGKVILLNATEENES